MIENLNVGDAPVAPVSVPCHATVNLDVVRCSRDVGFSTEEVDGPVPTASKRVIYTTRKRARLDKDVTNGRDSIETGALAEEAAAGGSVSSKNDPDVVVRADVSGVAGVHSGSTDRKYTNIPVDVKLSASKVAALCGYGHPFAVQDLPDHWTSLIYQHDHAGLARDAALLGLTLVDEETRMLEVLDRLESDGNALAAVIQESQAATVRTRQDVAAHVDAGTALVDAVARSGRLSADDADFLRSKVRQTASTSFGTRHEDTAIALYETEHGVVVTDSNSKRYVLYVDSDGSVVNGSSITRQPTGTEMNALSSDAYADNAGTDTSGMSENASSVDSSTRDVASSTSTLLHSLQSATSTAVDVDSVANTVTVPTSAELDAARNKSPDEVTSSVFSTAVHGGSQEILDDVAIVVNTQNDEHTEDTQSVPNNTVMNDATVVIGSLGTDTNPIVVSDVEKTGRRTFDVSDVEQTNAGVAATAVMHTAVTPMQTQDVPQKPRYPVAIVGYIDGMCEHVVPKANSPPPPATPTDDTSYEESADDLTLERTVVEIKNRVSKTAHLRPPPFYDFIQCVIYMKMTECTSCDLVEVFRNRSHASDPRVHCSVSRQSTSAVQSNTMPAASVDTNSAIANDEHTTTENDARRMPANDTDACNVIANDAPTAAEEVAQRNHERAHIDIRVTKVPLHGPPAHHADNWSTTIVPRLLAIASAIHHVRSNDHERYRWLVALAVGDDGAIWDILCNWCSFYAQIRPRDRSV